MSYQPFRPPMRAAIAVCIALQVFASPVGVPRASAANVAQSIDGLVDQDGRPFDGLGSAGTLRLVFFGYTNCPDICPTTLSDISLAVASLDAGDRNLVRPIFVSVDPRRDTADVVKSYLEPFGPMFTGVTGTVEAIDAYAWASGVYVVRNDGSDANSYTVDHTTTLFLIAADGSVADRIPYGVAVQDLADRLRNALHAP